jgi:hypothetical protein
MGVKDPGLLLRATAIENATADLLQQASLELVTPTDRDTDKAAGRPRTTAEVAAADGPRDPAAALRAVGNTAKKDTPQRPGRSHPKPTERSHGRRA